MSVRLIQAELTGLAGSLGTTGCTVGWGPAGAAVARALCLVLGFCRLRSAEICSVLRALPAWGLQVIFLLFCAGVVAAGLAHVLVAKFLTTGEEEGRVDVAWPLLWKVAPWRSAAWGLSPPVALTASSLLRLLQGGHLPLQPGLAWAGCGAEGNIPWPEVKKQSCWSPC